MTGPTAAIDPAQVSDAAAQIAALIPQFGQSLPQISGDGPDHTAVRAALLAGWLSTAELQDQLAQAAGTAQAGADAYASTEQSNGASLGDVANLLQTFIQPLAGIAGSPLDVLGGAFGDGGGAVATIVGSLTGLLGNTGLTGDTTGAPQLASTQEV